MAETIIARDPEVKGISPKAYIPAVIGVVTGLVILLVSVSTGDDSLRMIALGIVLAALGHIGIAWISPVGDVKVPKPKPEVVVREVEVEKLVEVPAKPAPRKRAPAKKPAKKPAK